MKFSAALLLVSASAAAARKTITGKNAAKVLRSARLVEGTRKLDQEGELSFLGNYNMKFVSCKAGELVVNPENGDYEYGSVIIRACPSGESCDSDGTAGCKSGYGDYLVSIQTFVEAWMKDQEDNMNWDDNFNAEEYTECREYDVEQGEDDAENVYANYQFWVGPTCNEEGDDIGLAVFQDEFCSAPSDVAFEDLSNGWSLPFEGGGLVSTSCIDCMATNDNGEQELRELCEQVYEQSAAKCEEEMEYVGYYGANNNGCEYIDELLPATARSGFAGRVVGWLIFALLIVGGIGYIVWWRAKKASS